MRKTLNFSQGKTSSEVNDFISPIHSPIRGKKRPLPRLSVTQSGEFKSESNERFYHKPKKRRSINFKSKTSSKFFNKYKHDI